MQHALNDFLKYFGFLKELVKRDFKKKYYKSFLGVLWSILNPLMMTIVITIIFSTLFRRNIEFFPVYYLIGTMIYSFNNAATNQGLHSLVSNNSLLRKIYVPKYMFCLSSVILQFITMLFTFITLILMMLVLGVPFTKYFLLFPLPMIYIFCFSTGLALILSVGGAYFRDLNHLYGIFTMMWMYVTPLFYPISIIPEEFLFLWELNPLYIIITIARNLMLDGVMPSQKLLIVATVYSVLTLVTGIVVFRQKEDKVFLHI